MKKYTYEEALSSSIEYFNGDELAAKVFIDKYALKNNEGEILEKTPEDMHWRLAKEFARIEKKKFKEPYSEQFIFDLLHKFKYIVPQGSPMSAIGNKYQVQSLGNCFVIPSPLDSYGGICYTDQQLVQLMKRRAGVGFDISNIRPKGMPTKNAAKTTDGIAIFMERFSNSCREVAQNGRRGAEIQSLSVHHPEIETFINIKRNLDKVTGANISIKITDEFMEAVKAGKEYEQRWPVNSKNPVVSKMCDAKSIWDKIVDSNHASAEPGLLFIDTIQNYSLSDPYKDIDSSFEDISTNPCSEIPMGVDSCRLLIINLLGYISNPFTDKASFDYDLFSEHSKIAQRLMDDIIDLELEIMDKILDKIKSDPEPEHIKKIEIDTWEQFKKNCINGRRTGLGITALGDTLASLNIKYGSKESILETEKIYKILCLSSFESSCLMAEEIGPFPLWNEKIEKNNMFLNRILDASPKIKELHNKFGRRNISLTTTAPAGSVSILTQSTSGIEPVFMVSYIRRRKIDSSKKGAKVDFVDSLGDQWEENEIYHHNFKKWMEISGETDIKLSPYFEATSNNIDWEASVDILSAAQKWVSHSISKTCNVPNDTPKSLMSKIYMKAWESKCKGFTVYRDGCRSGVLISSDKKEESNKIQKTIAPKRSKVLNGCVHHFTLKSQRYYVAVGLIDTDVYEVFAALNHDHDGEIIIPKDVKTGVIRKESKGKYFFDYNDNSIDLTNGHTDENVDALTRIVSTALRHGADISFVVHQLEKTKGSLVSFAKFLARALKKHIPDGTEVHGEECPECKNNKLVREDGCIKCPSCGWTKCS